MRNFFIVILFFPLLVCGQNRVGIPTYTNVVISDSGYLMTGIIIDGDTFPYVKLYKIVIFPERKFTSKRKARKYSRLRYNVRKVYPYAILIGEYYAEAERDLAYIPERRDQRKYVKRREKELRGEYESTLMDLTYTQGRLLIKLVDRQTEHTTFEVVKELKGNMSAYFWQSIAVLFGANLKSEYDKEEDQMIEEIIAEIENGE